MNFKVKQYKVIKTKRLFKNYTIFIFKGLNWQFESLVRIKQKLLNFSSSKVFISTLQKLLESSIFKLNKSLINGSLFLIFTFQTKLFKKKLTSFLQLWSYGILALKMHNKIYNRVQLKQIFVLNYNNYKSLFTKFIISLLKNKKF